MRHVKYLFSTLILLLCCVSVSAHDFEVDGIYYNITSEEELTVEVTYQGNYYDDYEEYYGVVSISPTVTYNGETYRVASIGVFAFYDCRSLTSITIPESVMDIGYDAFRNTAWYDNQPDGVIYINKVLYDYKGTMPANTSVEVEEGTISISHSAFYGCSSLTSITIPESVTSIGSYAFSNCSGLTSITIPESVTSIGVAAFYYCTGITSIIIPESVTSIGSSAFNGCSSLTSITIPESVTSIGSRAFDGFPGELIVNCNIPDSEDSDFGAFCHGRFTKVTIGDGVTTIGDHAFSFCSDLTSITIPESVTSIGSGAFYDCTGELIVNCNIPSEPSPGYGVFFNSEFTKVTIGENVTSIGESAFSGCSSLTYVTIPESVTSIGRSAFYNCTGLTSITIIPESATSIGDWAFSGCSSLTSITIGDSVTSIGSDAFSGCSSLTSITIPESVTSIGNRAFSGCSSLTYVTIPESVTSIGSSAFKGCTGELTVNCNISYSAFKESKFTKVTIGDGVTTIGESAFEGCDSLTSITIPESVTSIRGGAFSGCTGELTVNCNIPSNAFKDSKFTKVTIGDSVTSIGWNAFYECDSLTSITIPESVTSIGSDAFSGCSSLTSITIPESVTSIGRRAFSECTGELIVNCNISYEAFKDSKITKVTIGDGVTTIESDAFSGCSSLTSITIPESVTSIERRAFSECTGELIVNCNIPSVYHYSYSDAAFYNSRFTKVAIGDGVTSIGNYAFYECDSLTSIVLPKSLETVGSQAFAGCSSLSNVYCYAESVPSTESDAFGSSDLGTTVLHVSESALDSYKATAPWSNFGIFLPLGKYITDIELSHSSITLVEGKTLSLGVTFTPEDTDLILIAWSSSNPDVATVDKQGMVKAVAPGTATITATAIDGSEVSDSCEVTVLFADYVITYLVDGEVYATDTIARASAVTPLAAPIKEGYTFSGWSEVPETMPGHDVTVSGTFTINKYLVTFAIDGVVISFNSQEYGTAIVPPEVSEREGYTFSGWLNLPESVPASDITINGRFAINKYLITYIVEDEVYHTDSIAYGTYITSIKNPVKEGYTFTGWGEIPEKMPTNDVTVIGSFNINKYKVTYTADDVTIYTDSIVYGGQIKDIASPTKEGYSFDGWEKVYQTMPARDIVINGTFTINKYQISYVVGGETIHTDSITYNERITPIDSPEQEGFNFSGWIGVPGIMPAYDVTVGGEFFIKNMQTDSQGLMYVLNEETETFELSNYEGNLTGTIVIPTDLYGYPVNGIKDRALMGAENLIHVVIPENISSVGYRVFYGCNNISYIEWETTAPVDAKCFDEPARHGNLLVYVKDTVTQVTYQGNVIVDGVAEKIVISNAQPLRNIRDFKARNISFTREFAKRTKIGTSGGWEAMVLPFDVQRVVSETRGELKPFGEADFDTSLPYWLGELQADGSFAATQRIVANKPFIMQLPNSDEYEDCYNVEGKVTFSAEEVTVLATTDVEQEKGEGYSLLGSYEGIESDNYIYALNDEEYAVGGDTYMPGGVFVAGSRDIRPFEAYIYSASANRAPYLRIGGCDTGMEDLVADKEEVWHTLQGIRLAGRPTERGIYIRNGKKVMVK